MIDQIGRSVLLFLNCFHSSVGHLPTTQALFPAHDSLPADVASDEFVSQWVSGQWR